MLIHSDTLSRRSRGNQSLLLHLNAACVSENHEIPIKSKTYFVYKTIVLPVYVQIQEKLKG
jgi:hypothetical protein